MKEKKFIISLEITALNEQKAFETLQELVASVESFQQLAAEVEDLTVEEDEE